MLAIDLEAQKAGEHLVGPLVASCVQLGRPLGDPVVDVAGEVGKGVGETLAAV